jgi:phage terminase large subunit-like protein
VALVALHHLLTVEDAKVYCVAASVPQARILFEAAADFARRLDHPEHRVPPPRVALVPGPGRADRVHHHMRVLGAEGPRLHGLSPTLMILDELQAVTREDIYAALGSALHKRPDSKLVIISTAGQGVATPLGQLRQRALGLPEVKRRGALTDACGPDLRMLEWAVPDDADVEDVREVKKVNPASWLTAEALREQRERLPDLAFRRFIANQSPRLVRRAQTRLTG